MLFRKEMRSNQKKKHCEHTSVHVLCVRVRTRLPSFNTPSRWAYKQVFIPRPADDHSQQAVGARVGGRWRNWYKLQRTEISYDWKSLNRSRRLCIMFYKSPIQTELMEYYTSKDPTPSSPHTYIQRKLYNSQLGRGGGCCRHWNCGKGPWSLTPQ